MTTVDLLIALLYLMIVVGIGLFSAKRNKSSSQLFQANREISWVPLGISVMISAFSAINFIAFPSEIIKNGPGVVISLPVFIIILIPIIRWIIPFFRRQSGVSGYAFLEERFSFHVKQLATVLFTLWRLVWIAVTLYASAQMLTAVTGYSIYPMILLTGVTALAYASLGGFRAVVYTDTLQFFTLFGTIVITLIFAFNSETVSVETIQAWYAAHPFPDDYFSWNPTIRLTFWSGLIGTFVAFFARYGADQITIQRYMAAKSDQEAVRTISLNAIVAVVVLSLLLFWGIVVAIASSERGVMNLPPIKQMILFISTMPKGVLGLFTAGLLAATMSSIDSGLNSMAAVFSNTKRFNGKRVTVLLGTIAIGAALLIVPIMTHEKSVFVVVNKIVHGFGAPLLVLILLGISSLKISSKAVFIGTALGAIFSIISVLCFTNIAVHYYAVFNAGVTVILLALCHILFPQKNCITAISKK